MPVDALVAAGAWSGELVLKPRAALVSGHALGVRSTASPLP